MKMLSLAVIGFVTVGFAHNSYTGGYSGAPGRQTCASSCHGGTGGTLVVSGFPSTYQPLQTYRIAIKHNGGSLIVNFNATTRIGLTASVAGTFTAVTNSTLYTGVDGGVYASPHAIDSAVFQWRAPAAGTGAVNFYAAAFQGTTSSLNGQSSHLTLGASESTTSVEDHTTTPKEFGLSQNYPNPFNPSTMIRYQLPQTSPVVLRVYNLIGQEVATLVNQVQGAGSYEIPFHGGNFASGVYLYRLQAGTFTNTKKMVLLP